MFAEVVGLAAAAELGRLIVPLSPSRERPPPAPTPAFPAVMGSSSGGGCLRGKPSARLVDLAKLAVRQEGLDGCCPASRVL